MSLVADYNSSADSDSESEDSDEEENKVEGESKERLPLPSSLSKLTDGKSREKLLERKTSEHSVYSNPYVRNAEVSLAIISKHTELTDKAELTTEERKAKKREERQQHRPCRKFLLSGTCKYGSACKFMHVVPETTKADPEPSPVHCTPSISQCSRVDETLKKKNKTITNVGYLDPPVDLSPGVGSTDDVLWEGGGNVQKRKRPGLTDNIVPSKKALQMYKDATKISY